MPEYYNVTTNLGDAEIANAIAKKYKTRYYPRGFWRW